MRATILGLLQRSLLQAWADATQTELGKKGKKFSDFKFTPKEFKKEIAYFVGKLPTDFFTELKYQGFDASKSLREELIKHMLSVLEGQKTMADIRSKSFWQPT